MTRYLAALSKLGIAAMCSLALAGCTAPSVGFVHPDAHTPTPAHTAAAPGNGVSVAPKVGDCWVATYTEMWNWSEWQGDAPVACSAAHQAYTYAVITLTGEFSDSWQNSATDDSLQSTVQNAAGTQCDAQQKSFLGDLKWNEGRIGFFIFVPPLDKWKAGDRTVRCDVSYFAFGSKWSDSELGNLPPDIATFVSDAKSDPVAFEECLNVPSGSTSGPLTTNDATWADCRTSPDWILSDHGTIPGDASAPYPGQTALQARAKQICHVDSLPTGQGYASYFPTVETWATGDRDVQCWTTSISSST